MAERLAFHIVRLGDSWCELCPRHDPAGFALPPGKSPVYLALSVKYQERMHADTFTVVLRCEQHIPEGSWVEGRDASTRQDDPEGDRTAEFIARQYSKRPREPRGLLPSTAPSRAPAQSSPKPAQGKQHGDRYPDRGVQSVSHGPTVRRVFEPR